MSTTKPSPPQERTHAASIGEVVRNARRGRYTLEELAAASGVSSGLISQLERGMGNPSMVTLSKLAEALELPIGAFFQGRVAPPTDPVIREGDRLQLVLPHEGLTYQLLTPGMNRSLAMIRTTMKNGFDNLERPFVHVGEECVHVLSGSLDVLLDGDVYNLGGGDSITYDSAIPHAYRALSDVEIIAAMTPPSF